MYLSGYKYRFVRDQILHKALRSRDQPVDALILNTCTGIFKLSKSFLDLD
jgi:hypothetical protein